MGLMLNQEYVIDDLGISIPTAYAKIGTISISETGTARTVFNIHKTRESVIDKVPLTKKLISVDIDKTLPIYSQIYTAAKEYAFKDWEDDIIEELNDTNSDSDELKE